MSIELKEGDLVRFKPFEVNQVSAHLGGKIGLVLEVIHKSFAFGETKPDLVFIEVKVLVDGQIEKVGIGYLEKVEVV